jgi:glycosyltransferase involved in cell wall biosynthesis
MTLKYAKKCQIINAQNFPAPWVAVIAGKIFGKPVIWTLYDVPQKISWKKRNSLVEYLIWFFAASVIDKLLVSQIDEIIVQGNFEYKKVLKRYGRKSKIIMPVINERFFIGSKKPFRLGVNLSGKYIMVSASHLHFRKNQKIIIKAFKKVESKIKEPLLVFAGDGPDKYKLIDLVKRLSLTDKVIFTGILSEKEMSELYSKSKLLLLPSLEEPYGLTPFEALLSGVCPIVSDRAGCSEVIRKYNLGYVVKPIVSNFAGTILKAYKNKKEVLADINRGKLWIKKNMAPIRYAKEHELIFRKYV